MVNVVVIYNSSCSGGSGFAANVTNNPTIAGSSKDINGNSESFQFEYDLICSDAIHTLPISGLPSIFEAILRINSNGNLAFWYSFAYNNGQGGVASGAAQLVSLTNYDFIHTKYVVNLSVTPVTQGTYIGVGITQSGTNKYSNTWLLTPSHDGAPTISNVSPTACMCVVAGTAGGTTTFSSGSFSIDVLSVNSVNTSYVIDTYQKSASLSYTCSGTTYHAQSPGEGTNLSDGSVSRPTSYAVDFTAS